MSYINRLFPNTVITCETNMANLSGDIYPEEKALVVNAVSRRKEEFAAGRLCAKMALSELGIHNYPILMNEDRSPIWPAGVVGSITHTRNYCGVALSSNDKVQSVGLDSEVIDEVGQDSWRIICSQDELEWIFQWPPQKQQAYVALFFSAKECFYKCQYPVSKQWVGFKDVRILIENPEKCEFQVILLKNVNREFKKNASFQGSYSINGKYVFTGMILPWSK